ncbi:MULTISPECIES: hypothetical protein [Erwiniaceae]|uniref:Uncharacterized protein n=2 Tax=Erwiniaceae TaxID=1903409 RepID=A0ACC5RIC7_ENTAG|nr:MULTISPECIES: hypothetical protein [Erwiniaceae]MBK4724446.1 hypothetical protein [Pantoea agglomerans]MBP2154408.1 hypothetical protein [Erwinia rhapontici]MCS3607064.1 hypothetical protein [Erwinia rhapontici]NKG30707.1 hypothetical protein [Erwinia rhapontici]NNS06569.1 hypothetical protein [Erwinia sp. JH02]
MSTEEAVPISSEEEVCTIIGKAVVDLSITGQPVNKSTLGLKLLAMADQDQDDERILLYWIARRAINQPHKFAEARF